MIEDDTTPFITNFCQIGDKIKFEGKIYKVTRIDIVDNTAYARRSIEGNGFGLMIFHPHHFIQGEAIKL